MIAGQKWEKRFIGTVRWPLGNLGKTKTGRCVACFYTNIATADCKDGKPDPDKAQY